MNSKTAIISYQRSRHCDSNASPPIQIQQQQTLSVRESSKELVRLSLPFQTNRLSVLANIPARSERTNLQDSFLVRNAPVYTSVVVAAASILVFIGWQYRIPLLKGLPGQVTVVSPNAAACLLLGSIAAILLWRYRSGWPCATARILGGAVGTFAFLTLLEYMFGIDLGIRDIVLRHRLDDWPVPTPPGRFAIQTAFGLTFLGAALAFVDKRFRSVELSEVFVAIASLSSLIGILGYVYGASAMHGVMAGATVILYTILLAGVALLRPKDGAARLILGNTSGGIASRRLITSTVLLLTISGWIGIRLQHFGYTSLELSVALFVTWAMVAVVLLIVSTAYQLDRVDRQREAATDALAESLIQKQFSEDRLNEGLDTANAGIWDLNLRTGELYWSKGHYTLLGYKEDEFKPGVDDWRRAVHPEDLPIVEHIWGVAVKNHTPFACQYRVIWPDGSQHWIETHGKFQYDSDGAPMRSVGGFVDITDRKRSQQALMEAEKLAATGRMAATLAHEINNPLAAVTNLIYLLKTGAAESPEALQQYLQVADDEIRRVSQLVQKTLSFYRSDVRPGPTKISSLIDDITWLYKKRIRDFGITVVKHDAFAGEITCNSGEIRQVLTNVFVNAMDAVGSGGRIVIHITGGNALNGSSARGVRVNIYDNGPGIPLEVQQRLFAPFVSMKGDQGTGLGLWISKGIIEKNRGLIRFRTSTGERHGTCFSIFIPDHNESAVQEPALAQAASSSLTRQS